MINMLPLLPSARQLPDIFDDTSDRPISWQRALLSWLDTLDAATTRRNYRATITSLFALPLTDDEIQASFIARREARRQKLPLPAHPQPFQTRPGIPAFIGQVTPQLLSTWRGHLQQRIEYPASHAEHIAKATANRHLSAARAFFTYWLDLGHVAMSKDVLHRSLKIFKGKTKRPYPVLTDGEVTALLDATKTTGIIEHGQEHLARKPWARVYKGKDDVLGNRDAVIITVALATGLRCDELRQLNVGDIQDREREVDGQRARIWFVTVRHGKGDKSRTVPLSQDDAATVQAYLHVTGRSRSRAGDQDEPLFLNRRGYRLSTSQIRRIIDAAADYATASGLITGKQVSPHVLRHTYAVTLLKGDAKTGRRPASVAEVQKVMGHASILTTQGYLDHIEDDQLADIAPTISRKQSATDM